MNPTAFEDDALNADVRGGRLRLLGIGATLLLTGVGLAAFGGPPRLPSELPRPEQVATVLTGTRVPLDGLALVLVDVAWLAWGWSVLSLVLELLLLAAELAAYGRGWVVALRHLVDRLSVPLVRRAVATAFAVEVIGRTVTIAAAQPLPATEPVVLASAPRDPAADRGAPDALAAGPTYLVRPGDTLWSIAEKAYGSGLEYRRLVEANVGRPMPNGQVFAAQGVIQPGWRLLAPGAAWDAPDQAGQRWYIVQPGDSLSSIAGMLFGDSGKWQDLFELNRGALSADGQHQLVEPNTIWPGLRLRLPLSEAPATELQTASAPQTAAYDRHPVDRDPRTAMPPQAEADASDPPPQPEAAAPASPPPLLRTPHALQPVMLDASDAPPSDPEANNSDAASQSNPVAETEVSVPPLPAAPQVPLLPVVVGGLGLAGAAGLAFGARRLRRLRPLSHEPESEVVVQGGFAEAQLAHDLTRGMHGVGFDPLAALVTQLEQFLLEYNLSGVEVVALRHGRSSTTITLHCGLAQQALLLDLAAAFAERLEADVEACVSTDQDVVLRLVRLRKTRLLPTADTAQAAPCLVPLGVLYDRQTYATAWRSLGHVLVVSLPGHGADTILASLVATLSARRSPEQLRIWIVGSPRALPAPLFELPHLEQVVDPADAEALSDAIEHLRAELDWRAVQSGPLADLLVVVPELASLAEHAESLALLAARAADLGVRLAVASADPEQAAASPLTPCFATRMVLRMQSEEMSVALLGVADAAFLAGGGRLLLRLDGREAVELYGYRVAAEHLERLVKVMRSAYAAPPPEPPVPADLPHEPPVRPAPPGAEASPESPTTTQEAAAPAAEHGDDVLSEPSRAPGPAEAPASPLAPAPAVPEARPSALDANRPTSAGLTQTHSSAPIQVFCFGRPRVVCQGEPLWPRVGGDAKPWELVLFLACQPVEGASRELVIATMWPEALEMAEDANHRFRQLRYRLRRQLHEVPDGPASDGVCMDRRGLRLDPAIIRSDAHEFLTLEREARLHPNPIDPEVIARLECARALYAGDLMDSPDAHRYAWVDERDESGVTLREHFRRLFQNASLRLAEAYTSLGCTAEAIEVYHELTEMDPSDERLFQALFRLQAEAGDVLGLQAEERRMRQLLRDLAADMEEADPKSEEPDQETLQEYERLLASLREPAAV